MASQVQVNPFFQETIGAWSPGALFEDPTVNQYQVPGPISNPLAQPGGGGGFMPGPQRPMLPTGGPQGLQPAQPQPSALEQALGSPSAAMAGSALQNLANTSLKQYGAQVDPIQAYQQAIQQRAVLSQREQALAQSAATEKRAQEEFDIAKDPGYKYRTLVKQGLIDPTTTSFVDFQRMGLSDQSSSVQKNYAQWLEVNPNATEEEKKAALDNIIRAPITYGMGAGSTAVTSGVSPGTGGGVLAGPEQVIANDAAREEAVAGANVRGRSIEEVDRAFVDMADSGGIDELENSLKSTNDLLAAIDSGAMSATGPLEGAWAMFVGDPETARLQAKSTLRTLQNLQITNLAPVTEAELKLVADMYANISRDPAQNIAILRDAAAMLQQKLDIINRKGSYYSEKGTLEGFGTQRWTKKDQPIPLYGAPGTPGEPPPPKTYNPVTGEFE